MMVFSKRGSLFPPHIVCRCIVVVFRCRRECRNGGLSVESVVVSKSKTYHSTTITYTYHSTLHRRETDVGCRRRHTLRACTKPTISGHVDVLAYYMYKPYANARMEFFDFALLLLYRAEANPDTIEPDVQQHTICICMLYSCEEGDLVLV